MSAGRDLDLGLDLDTGPYPGDTHEPGDAARAWGIVAYGIET